MNTLKRRIAALEKLQEQRKALVAERINAMYDVIDAKQREIDNLKARLAAEPRILRVAQ